MNADELSAAGAGETPEPPRISPAHAALLAAPVPFLESRSDELVGKWTGLYLSTFGRRSFFSPERVGRVFREMAALFIACLKKSDFTAYFGMLRSKGRLFCELGVPFEEIVLCLQLFEESYLSLLLENRKASRHRTEDILLAFEELRHGTTGCFAESYFGAVKKNWQNACRGYQEENERLRRELAVLRDEVFSATKGELASMELLIRGINQKLRRSVVQSRRIQMFAELLDRESSLPNLLRVADKFLRQVLPADSQVFFALFDENQRKFRVHWRGAIEADADTALGIEEVFLPQLAREFREALFADPATGIVVEEPARLGPLLGEAGGRLAAARSAEGLFLPVRKCQETLGFLVLAASEKNVFNRASLKYYQRLGRVFARAYFGLLFFGREKRHGEFISVLDQLEERVLQRNSLESTLDFCLGSLLDLVQVERASLMLLDRSRGTLGLYAAKGYRVYPFSGLELKAGEGIAGWCLKEGRIVAIPRMRPEEGTARAARASGPGEAPPLPVKSLLCVPVAAPGAGPLGVINLSTLSYHKRFEKAEIDMAHQFAQRIHTVLTSLAPAREFESAMRANG